MTLTDRELAIVAAQAGAEVVHDRFGGPLGLQVGDRGEVTG